MKRIFVVAFFIFTLLTGTMSHNTSHARDNLTDLEKANIIFNWLEPQFPEILSPSPQPTLKLASFYYRYYRDTNVYLATFIDRLWFIDQSGTPHDLGDVDFWVDLIDPGNGNGDLIGFGPVRIGETWVEHRYSDPNHVGMCHTFVSHNQVDFQYSGMSTTVSIPYVLQGSNTLLFRTADGVNRGDQTATYRHQIDANKIDVLRIWYYPDGTIDDEHIRYWKRMNCPH